MKYVGAHVSASGGVENAPLNAHEIGATAFALFTKNQRQWHSKPLTKESITAFKQNCTEYHFNKKHILPHASYLINLCSPDAESIVKSRAAFVDELNRCEQLDLPLLNIHAGSHLGKYTEAQAIKRIADSINHAHSKTKEIIVVLENTAGAGNTFGARFEQLAGIIDAVKDKKRIGVCIDTCHAFAAGYDLRTIESCEKVFHQFQKIIGFRYLLGMHLNDSKTPFESHKDRHESLGKGELGMECFKYIMQSKHFENIPLILETPNPDLWPKEIKMLESFI